MSFPWFLTFDDTSPVLSYQPYGDGIGLSNGWSTWYSQSGFVNSPGVSYGDVGLGESYHITSLPGANVTLTFNGTGVVLYGNANCTYQVLVDGQIATSSSDSVGTLFSQNGLPLEMHTVTLVSGATLGSTEQLALDAALVSSVADNPAFLDNGTQLNATNTSVIAYGDGWYQTSDNGVPAPGLPETPFYETGTAGSVMSFQFMGEAVELHGDLNFGHGQYTINLDGNEQTLNGSSFFKVPDTILFYQNGLDEDTPHTLNLTNLSGGNENLTLNWIYVYNYKELASQINSTGTSAGAGSTSTGGTGSPSPTSGSDSSGHSSTNIGEIVGPIVGVIGLAVIGVLIFLWWRRRRNNALHGPQDWDHQVRPYVDDEPVVTEFTGSPPPTVPSFSMTESQFPLRKGMLFSPSTTSTPGETITLMSSQPFSPSSSSGQSGIRPHTPGLSDSSFPFPSPTLLPAGAQVPVQFEQPRQNPSAPPPEIDVDRILEMISQRIDGPLNLTTPRPLPDPEAPPPAYPQFRPPPS